ncbi:hypothetical protein XELAEV_18043998mg [Xenopus laevis]|uniref:Uncharacterized protein n=1 Tax=Xenopus laevis TaxID=8355 RepID=A0A974BYA7_XENLA|nr:hypothetical protein XELAEV_18043998mg [Xenopus laevis]
MLVSLANSSERVAIKAIKMEDQPKEFIEREAPRSGESKRMSLPVPSPPAFQTVGHLFRSSLKLHLVPIALMLFDLACLFICLQQPKQLLSWK